MRSGLEQLQRLPHKQIHAGANPCLRNHENRQRSRMSIVDEINGMVKSAQVYDPRRLGGTMFAQRRKSPATTTYAAAGTGQASSAPMYGFGWTAGGAGSTQATQTPTGATGGATAAQAPATQASAKAVSTPRFNFAAEAAKLLKPVKNDYASRGHMYSNEGRKRYGNMMSGFADDVRKMRGKQLSEKEQRMILDNWKTQLNEFRPIQSGESTTIGRTKPGTTLVQKGRGIFVQEAPRSRSQGVLRSTPISEDRLQRTKIKNPALIRSLGKNYVTDVKGTPEEDAARREFVNIFKSTGGNSENLTEQQKADRAAALQKYWFRRNDEYERGLNEKDPTREARLEKAWRVPVGGRDSKGNLVARDGMYQKSQSPWWKFW